MRNAPPISELGPMYMPPPTRNRPTVSCDGGPNLATWSMVGSQMVALLDTLWETSPE